jgi:hypothetical protein
MVNSRWWVSNGFLRSRRQRHVAPRVAALVMMAGGIVLAVASSAFATAPLSVSPASGLNARQTVVVDATGLGTSSPGYILECNNAPGEPTVLIGPPFDTSVPIGCSPPSLKHLVYTKADGTLAATFKIVEGRKLGPPCGLHPVLSGCPRADTAGKTPRADAQNYPCPPSPEQQAAGVTCSLIFIDTAKDHVSAPIAFLGGGPAAPTTAPPPTLPPTTAPPAPPTTSPRTTTPVVVSSGGSPPSGPAVGTAGTSSSSGTTPGVVKASSGSLAFTGLGTTGKLVALAGGILVLLGLVVFFVDVRKLALWLLGM